MADLEADVEPPEEDLDDGMESLHEEDAGEESPQSNPDQVMNEPLQSPGDESDSANADQTVNLPRVQLDELADRTSDSDSAAEARLEARLAAESEATPSQPVPIASKTAVRRANSPRFIALSPNTPENSSRFSLAGGVTHDHLLTPRNDAGPFVLDGAAGRVVEPDG